MNCLSLPFLVPALAIIGFTASSHNMKQDMTFESGLSCTIEQRSKGAFMEYAAVVGAQIAIRGAFSFNVTSKSTSGTSSVTQGGEFALIGGANEILSVAMVGGSDVTAWLWVETDDGARCEATL